MLIFLGNITQGLPEFKLPPFEFYDSAKNQTVSFTDMCSTLGTGLIIVPLVALLENIAICKAFCKYPHFILFVCVSIKQIMLRCTINMYNKC
jgi:hypothetical protein